VGSLALLGACSNLLDVNENPNAPQIVTANLYLPPLIHWMATSPQYDGRFVGRYTQQWILPGNASWNRMGYDVSSDNGGQQWRDVYWTFGQNLIDMMEKAEAEKRWDLLGVGYLLKAWGWQALTDLHGEIVVKEAFDPTKFSFDYDSQEYVYQEIQNLLNQAIENLQKTDGAVDQAYLAKGDKMYNGDRTKWLKLAYGMLAINLNHYSNKASYNPDAVIAAVDKSFVSNADDALQTYPKTNNDDTNFWGRMRDNITSYRQTQFVVGLMDGTEFGGVVDPRMERVLSPSNEGNYIGLDPIEGYGALTTDQRPNALFGPPGETAGRYIFDDKAKIPVVTYSQLQFIKAEAALRKGDRALALEAYKKALESHLTFVNARNLDNNQAPTQITQAEMDAFLASAEIIPTADNLTLSHIMSQKFIALFGWGHNEIWLDMRRYHYTDMDPESGVQVFRGFRPPTTLAADNAGKLVQRIRPRYNSEYVWNRAGLDKIGGLASDYHTVEMWITTSDR
jgi:tetratricopeptide (TPR) repeat protein